MASEAPPDLRLAASWGEDAPVLVLASQSPRRAALLRKAGFGKLLIHPAPVPDPDWPHRQDVKHPEPDVFVAELALRKAMAVADMSEIVRLGNAVIVAADTICIDENEQWLGKPRDVDHARALLQELRNNAQTIWTGVALVRQINPGVVMGLRFFAESAAVRLGEVSDDDIECYLSAGNWKGKAGGYNITELKHAGWPIEIEGHEHTVVGLPVSPIVNMLREWGLHPELIDPSDLDATSSGEPDGIDPNGV